MYWDGTAGIQLGDVSQAALQLGFSEAHWAIEITRMCKEVFVVLR